MGHTVLLLGSSNVSYSGEGVSLAGMLEDELADSGSDEAWSVQRAGLPPGRSMAENAVALVEERRPDAVIVSVAAYSFTYEFVSNRIRRRWPRLHGLALAVSQRLKAAAGGDAEESASPRSLIYRLPEGVAFRIVGGETAIPVEHAIANVTRALEALARVEDAAVIVRLPVGQARASGARKRRYEERLRAFNTAIKPVCERHRIPWVDVAGELAASGSRASQAFDGIHLDQRTRAFEAQLLARAIRSAAEGDSIRESLSAKTAERLPS